MRDDRGRRRAVLLVLAGSPAVDEVTWPCLSRSGGPRSVYDDRDVRSDVAGASADAPKPVQVTVPALWMQLHPVPRR